MPKIRKGYPTPRDWIPEFNSARVRIEYELKVGGDPDGWVPPVGQTRGRKTPLRSAAATEVQNR